jgi:hypothetical protein
VLTLIRAHALLEREYRKRDGRGHVVADAADYGVICELVGPLFTTGGSGGVSARQREAIEAVQRLSGVAHPDGVPVQAVADELGIDRSAAQRRLYGPIRQGFIANDPARPRGPWRLKPGDSHPGTTGGLPDPEDLAIQGFTGSWRSPVTGEWRSIPACPGHTDPTCTLHTGTAGVTGFDLSTVQDTVQSRGETQGEHGEAFDSDLLPVGGAA